MTVTVNYQGMSGTRISAKTMLPAQFTLTYDSEELPLVDLDMAVIDGVPVCDAVRIQRREGGASLTGTELRRVPVAEIIDFASTQVATRNVETFADGSTAWEPTDDDPEGRRQVQHDVRKAIRRRAITDELLRDVARIYRLNPGSPTKSVSEALHVSPAQASRYVRQARERQFLEEYPS